MSRALLWFLQREPQVSIERPGTVPWMAVPGPMIGWACRQNYTRPWLTNRRMRRKRQESCAERSESPANLDPNPDSIVRTERQFGVVQVERKLAREADLVSSVRLISSRVISGALE